MAIVYISSTFSDLEQYRQCVYKTLRTIPVDVRDTMEHAVARNERPLKTRRKDIRPARRQLKGFVVRPAERLMPLKKRRACD